jgi:hypothetical protein
MVEREDGGKSEPKAAATRRAVVTGILTELGAQRVKGPVGTAYEVPQEEGDPVRVVLIGSGTYEVGGARFHIGDFTKISPAIAREVVESDIAHMRVREGLLRAGASGATVPTELRVNEALEGLNARRTTGPVGTPYLVGERDQDPVRVVLINGGRISYEVNGTGFNTHRLGRLPTEKALEVVRADVDYMRARAAILRPPAARGR